MIRNALALICLAVAPVALFFAYLLMAWNECRGFGHGLAFCVHVLLA